MIDSIQVLENLLFVAEKAGLFEFELGQLLTDFLGDVQIVAEFKDYGADIFKRFADTIGAPGSSFEKPQRDLHRSTQRRDRCFI
jgi:hypothetical protein